MLLIIGIILVMICVVGGFLMIDGPLGVLLQPSEFVVIGGAVIGATLAANPLKFLMRIMKLLPAAMKGSPYNQGTYTEVLRMQYDVFVNSKKGGLISIEEDVNSPFTSSSFIQYPTFIVNNHAIDFFC